MNKCQAKKANLKRRERRVRSKIFGTRRAPASERASLERAYLRTVD